MVEFILKYWVDFLFGIMAAWALGKIKHYQDLEKKDREDTHNQMEARIMKKVEEKLETLLNQSNAGDNNLKADIDGLNTKIDSMIQAILSMQGKGFIQLCQRLLKPGHIITTEEYEQCIQDHDAYNGIGGNHRGDLLFDAVSQKYRTSVSDDNEKKGES